MFPSLAFLRRTAVLGIALLLRVSKIANLSGLGLSIPKWGEGAWRHGVAEWTLSGEDLKTVIQ